MTAAPLLSIEDLSLSFGSHRAVKHLSFNIARGETVALVGESGSGKSATALAIMRLIEREGGAIAGGRIVLDGTPPLDLAALTDRQMRQVRGNRVAMIFQEPMTALNPVLTLGDQVSEVLRLHQGMDRVAARAAALAAFDRVRIPDAARRLNQFAHELSGGLRQRVMIAAALACRPDLLIADEPTTALDVTTQAEILALIRDLQAETGMSVLFITHDMGVVANLADRVVVLARGETQEEGPVHDIFARPQAAYTRTLMAATPKLGSGAPAAIKAAPVVLDVKNLSVRFGVRHGVLRSARAAFHAVTGVSLTIGRGETLGLVGESGCGKSTLARAILRLVEPAEGRIHLMGQEVTGLSQRSLRPLRCHAQIVAQDPFASLNPRLPVHQLITEPALIHGQIAPGKTHELALELLAKVELGADALDRYPHQFSGGQRQRLSIARALSARPALIIADEAVSALDVSVARQITDLMARLQAEDGVSFLFISHDIAVVERVSHRIAVMFGGQIVETGTTDRVLSNPTHAYTRHLLSAVPVPDPAKRDRFAPRTTAQIARPTLLLPNGQQPHRMVMAEIAPGHFSAVQNETHLAFAAALSAGVPGTQAEADHATKGSAPNGIKALKQKEAIV
ncbi:MAG: ABC transporter ATP-binding protein [Rhodobacterales bacterium RIFCSPHIGHO2_02_FULL_62_130]|nr:MAG: ABC transporter ATP-binding protein [Rhodobacterales bacterium RIFCSPHIGHO2_02_FULL_62_130]OHC60282.1 MAG: ABC transporter ATP-binding protein [Rhodobacterales bacterium RIFCSPHIGHO2_12_FULL_62_75]HCZ01574.1 ABC transporter ATP-binding protein [Rhodobacter sp.]